MLILAIDTASMVSSLAVATEKKLVAELTIQTRLTHSETLLPNLEDLLSRADVKKEELSAIAVSIGPGSFTGLRIGLATGKALSYALGIPLIGVSTLEALAAHVPVPGVYTIPLIDAQKGNAYAAVYAWEKDRIKEVMPTAVLSLPEVLERCASFDRPVMLLGDLAAKRLLAAEELPANVQVLPPSLVMPRAAEVAMLAFARLTAGDVDSVMDLEPLYIRRSEAEVLWEKRHPEAKA